MADTWGLPEVNHWWLPDDEQYPAVIQSIRTCVEQRGLLPTAAGKARGEDQWNIKSIFANLKVTDDPSMDSLPSSSSQLANARRGR